MLFPFVRLELTSSIGPAAGRYPLAPSRAGDTPDALLIKVIGAAAPEGLLRRARRAADEAPRELALLQVTWAGASQPVAERDAFMARLRDEQTREDLVDHALGVTNLAILTYAAAAADPYARELSRFDPRAVHAGVGTGEELDDGTWTEAVACPPPPSRRIAIGERLRPDSAVAAALATDAGVPDGTVHLLRALLDSRMGRDASAAAELATGLRMLGLEASSDDLTVAARAALEALPGPSSAGR